jgi:SulP family sulfate permease
MNIVEKQPKIRIIRMRNVPAIDATGLQTLKDFYQDAKKNKTHLILSGVHTQPLYAMTQAGIFDLYGEENIHGNIDDALDRAREVLSLPKLGRPKDFVPTVKRDKS